MYIYDNISLNFSQKFEMFQIKFVEKITTHVLCSTAIPPPPPNRAVCEIMCKNMVQPDRPQMTI
jgi:hypothetical protein